MKSTLLLLAGDALPQEIDPLSFLLFMPFYIVGFLMSTLPPFPQLPSVATATSPKTFYSNIEEMTIKEMPNGTVKIITHRKAQRE